MSSTDGPEVTHDEEAGRFEVAHPRGVGRLEYRRAGAELRLVHTEVDDELEGEGIGSTLVREALAYAADADLTVVPECPFVASWLERHPDHAAELDVATP
jgi:uncharacterized protein